MCLCNDNGSKNATQTCFDCNEKMTRHFMGCLWIITVFYHITRLGLCLSSTKLTSDWMEERLYLRAQCKAKCLRLFQSVSEQALFKVGFY